MENNEIPSAESYYYDTFVGLNIEDNEELIPKMMKSFTALHVSKALEMAAENADVYPNKSHDNGHPMINKESILNCYPKELIK